MKRITSTANPLVKDLGRLRSSRHRRRQQRFLIEGHRELTRALAAGIPVETVIVCPQLGGAALPEAGEVIEMAEAPFRKLSIRQSPDGVLGVAPFLATDLARLAFPAPALVLWLEGVEKPGNLGAMLRTADAVGVDAVVVTGAGTDVHNPGVVRASQGALFTVPLAVASSDEVRARFAAEAIRVAALSPGAAAGLWEADLSGSLAVAVGAEDRGLSEETLAAADIRCSIPMAGTIDSLNASVAAAVVLYEVARRRQAS